MSDTTARDARLASLLRKVADELDPKAAPKKAPAKKTKAEKAESAAKWEAIKAAKAARAEKDVRCALNSKERQALAAANREALTKAAKKSRAAYDRKWQALVEAAVAAK